MDNVAIWVVASSILLCITAYASTAFVAYKHLGRNAPFIRSYLVPYHAVRLQLLTYLQASAVLLMAAVLLTIVKKLPGHRYFPDSTEAFYSLVITLGFGLLTLLLITLWSKVSSRDEAQKVFAGQYYLLALALSVVGSISAGVYLVWPSEKGFKWIPAYYIGSIVCGLMTLILPLIKSVFFLKSTDDEGSEQVFDAYSASTTSQHSFRFLRLARYSVALVAFSIAYSLLRHSSTDGPTQAMLMSGLLLLAVLIAAPIVNMVKGPFIAPPIPMEQAVRYLNTGPAFATVISVISISSIVGRQVSIERGWIILSGALTILWCLSVPPLTIYLLVQADGPDRSTSGDKGHLLRHMILIGTVSSIVLIGLGLTAASEVAITTGITVGFVLGFLSFVRLQTFSSEARTGGVLTNLDSRHEKIIARFLLSCTSSFDITYANDRLKFITKGALGHERLITEMVSLGLIREDDERKYFIVTQRGVGVALNSLVKPRSRN